MRRFDPRRLGALFALSLFASPISGRAQDSAAPAPTTAALVAREIAAIELVGGGMPVTADERRLAAEAVASGMRGNPELWLRGYATWAQALQRAAGDRAYAATLRQAIRYDLELAKPAPPGLEQAYAIERQIIHARDATLVFDPQRSHILTESGLRDLHAASAWFAKASGLPAPSANFMANTRAWLQAHYAEADDNIARALANEAQNFSSATRFIARIDPQQREAGMQKIRAEVQAQAPDEQSRDALLMVAAAIVADQGAQQAKASAHPFPVDQYMDLVRMVLLKGATVRGINQNGPYSVRR